jgi:formate dehydrogenase gamma subunit
VLEGNKATRAARALRQSGLALCGVWLVLAAAAAGRAASPPLPPQKDSECLACHGTPGSKDEKGRNIYVDEAKHKSSVHGPLDCTACHAAIREYPHPQPVAKVDCATCHSEVAADVAKSTHSMLGAETCAACHGNAHTIRAPGAKAGQECRACHGDLVKSYEASVHGRLQKNGDTSSATCRSCHGPAHRVLSAGDPASPVAKKNLPGTCGSCHANPEFLAKHNIPFAHPVEAYRLSVHGRAVLAGNDKAASCSDCHGSHDILPGRDAHSRINHWNVPQTCGACHGAIRDTYLASIHGQAMQRGATGAPVCTDCHGEHNILAPSEPGSLVNPARVSTVTCGHCHGDERVASRYNLPLDRVPAFEDSFHGLALRAGSQTVANCASCHGIHNILASSDPRSTVHPKNIAATCGQCHAGAGSAFAIGRVHVLTASLNEHAVVKWIRWIYVGMILVTVLFIVLHNGADFLKKLRGPRVRPDSGQEVTRMNLRFRFAHWLVVISFPLLVVTGFALKYPDTWWAHPLLLWESTLAFRGTLHRAAAVILLAALVYHAMHLILSPRDRRMLSEMLPRIRDAADLVGALRYNFGLAAQKPAFGKFTYAEKFEYWAFLWGMGVMTVTGFLLWFVDFTLRHFPKWFSDAATAVHYYEAILATLSIVLWHFYMTVFDPDVYPMDRAWITGKTSADHLRHTRPEYFAQLMREEEARAAAAAAPAKGDPSTASAPDETSNPPRED